MLKPAPITTKANQQRLRQRTYRGFMAAYGLLTVLGGIISVLSWYLLPLLWPSITIGLQITVLLIATSLLLIGFAGHYASWLRQMKLYPSTGPFAVGLSAALIPFFILSYSSESLLFKGVGLLVPALFLAPLVYKTIISGSTYIARMIDAWMEYVNSSGEPSNAAFKKFMALFLGVLVGVIYANLVLAVGAVKYNSIFLGFASVFLFISGIASFGGLLNRFLGRGRMPLEQKAMRMVGVILALVAPFLLGYGIYPELTGTGIFTKIIGSELSLLIFIPSLVGAFVSMTDYISKTTVYFLGRRKGSKYEAYVNHKLHEYRGAAAGMIIGLGLAFVFLGIWTGLFLPGANAALLELIPIGNTPAAILYAILFTFGMSGSGSRFGRTLDERPLDDCHLMLSEPQTEDLAVVHKGAIILERTMVDEKAGWNIHFKNQQGEVIVKPITNINDIQAFNEKYEPYIEAASYVRVGVDKLDMSTNKKFIIMDKPAGFSYKRMFQRF